jgi:hypothetical protein
MFTWNDGGRLLLIIMDHKIYTDQNFRIHYFIFLKKYMNSSMKFVEINFWVIMYKQLKRFLYWMYQQLY